MKLDYSNGRNVKYNTVLCIDVSGSMAESDPIKQNTEISSAYDALYNNKQCDRIKGGNKYISLMTSEDQTAIVFFSSSATVKSEFTNDKSTLRMALQKMYNSGGTSFDSAIQKSVDLFSDEMINDPQVCNRIILISDGQSSYSLGPIREAASKNIQIYTIGLGSYSGDSSLKAISEITGATFAKIYSSDDLEYIYEQIYVEGAFDTTDTDGDGLYAYKDQKGNITIDDIDAKEIYYLNLSCCNNGNLDYVLINNNLEYSDNLAIAFLKSKHNIKKVTAWDGSASYKGLYVDLYGYDFVLSYEHSKATDAFDAWSREVNGWEREAEQQVTYWLDRQGNVVWDKEKHRID